MKANTFNKNNYINIQGWMITDLKLSGNDLLIYAIIHGFSQDLNSCFTGSLKYLESATNSSKNTVLKSLKSLLDLDLISKEETFINNVKNVKYTTFGGGGAETALPIKKDILGGAETEQGVVQKLHGGGAETEPNNKYLYNNINNSPLPPFASVGEFATDENPNKNLVPDWDKFIEQFNQITGKKINSLMPQVKAQVINLLTNGYSKNDLVKAFHKAAKDDWIKKNIRMLHPEYLTRPEIFYKYADD